MPDTFSRIFSAERVNQAEDLQHFTPALADLQRKMPDLDWGLICDFNVPGDFSAGKAGTAYFIAPADDLRTLAQSIATVKARYPGARIQWRDFPGGRENYGIGKGCSPNYRGEEYLPQTGDASFLLVDANAILYAMDLGRSAAIF